MTNTLLYKIWHAPQEFNAFAATFTLGFSVNLYAKITDDFAFNGFVARVFIRVPGSWSIRDLLSFASGVGLYFIWNTFNGSNCISGDDVGL